MQQPPSRIAPSLGAASGDSASPVPPSPGEPPDRLAFEPVPLRYRADGLTPEKQRAYVEALADCGVAREAAARIGLSEQAINRVRRRSDARSFDNACEAAHLFGARRLRSIAYERAVEGTLKGHYYHGERVSEERVYDNRLLIYLLGKTAHLLERDDRDSRAICDAWEAHMDALEQGLPPPSAPVGNEADEQGDAIDGEEVWQDENGRWWTHFPPPDGFEGEEEGVWNAVDWYSRSLTPREQAAVEALAADRWPARARAAEIARRDRFFGFAGGGNPFPSKAEPYETSEPSDPDPRPIEYKSLHPPRMTARAEGPRRGGIDPAPRRHPSSRDSGDRARAGFAGGAREERPLRASARPREPGPGRAFRPRHIQNPPPRHP